MAEVSSSDGAYTRTSLYDSVCGEDDPLIPELRALLNEWAGYDQLTAHLAKIGIEMREYGLNPATEAGQRKAAEVLRKRLTASRRWLDGTIETYERRAAIERGADSTSVVYYVDLYGVAIKIGTSANLLRRLASLRRSTDHLLAVEPGSYAVERLRHMQFAEERMGWLEDFSKSPALLAHVAALRAEHGNPLDYLASVGEKKPSQRP